MLTFMEYADSGKKVSVIKCQTKASLTMKFSQGLLPGAYLFYASDTTADPSIFIDQIILWCHYVLSFPS